QPPSPPTTTLFPYTTLFRSGEGLEQLEPYRVKRAVIIAAGFGSRMVPITWNTPKPLVRVHGKKIVETLLDAIQAAEIPEVILVRSEEHTSELQSRFDLVCRL